MAIIPETTNAIHKAIEDIEYLQEKREYLGMSGIGKSCARQIWYDWRWVKDKTISARVKRLFERGDLEEPRIVADLKKAGMIFSDDQLEVVHITGHSKGHIDGIVVNVPQAEKTPHLAEFKTMKNSSFNAIKKKAGLIGFEAALKSINSSYWCQIQVYMGYLGLTRCLYVITNKDTEERIYERVHYYKEQFDLIKCRLLDILTHELPPPRISERSDWFECRWCDFKDVCFHDVRPLKNCRTCKFADLLDEGKWACSINDNKELNKQDQLTGCDLHNYLEGL